MRISDWSSDVCSSDLGVPPQDIAVVERDPVFARVIAARFPQVRVLQGDASELRRLLREAGIGPVKAVVSGLPLLSIPDRICLRIIGEAICALTDDGVFVQFTYRSEEHTSELQSLMRISYAVFCLKKNKNCDTQKT